MSIPVGVTPWCLDSLVLWEERRAKGWEALQRHFTFISAFTFMGALSFHREPLARTPPVAYQRRAMQLHVLHKIPAVTSPNDPNYPNSQQLNST